MSADGGFDLQEFIPQILRSLAASNADNQANERLAAFEKLEMVAWDEYAQAWLRETVTETPIPPEKLVTLAADFADKMIDRRRKYFGVEISITTKPES